MNKALRLLDACFEFTKSNEMQHNQAELKQLELFRVFAPSDFFDKFGMLIGGIIGGGLAIYFSINLFANQSLWNIPGYVINAGFVILILGLNICVFFTTNFMGNFFTLTLTFKRIIEGSLACLIFLFITVKAATGLINLSEVFMYIGIINLFCEQLGYAMEGISVLVASDKYRKKTF